ncbi:MAG: cytochrome c nitrite reductase small subunit [Phycisphaerae bacterium]|nr:cytochrome c nitrite reductase small subunit [Phycisphaerae bacterium]
MNILSGVKSVLTLSGLSRGWQAAICVFVGLAIGATVITARLGNTASYLSDSPETCMNCHVMTDAYASWQRGSHGRVAVCTDCHVPHSNPIAKLAFKGADGLKHSYVFTARSEPQVLRLSAGAIPVVQANCLRCHSNHFKMIRLAAPSERKCWDCHSNVHGEVHGLSASPRPLRSTLPRAGL